MSNQEKTPKPQASGSRGPPKSPKQTARGLGDDSPDFQRRLASAERILREFEEKCGPKMSSVQRERFIRIFTHPEEPVE
jgi:hypothetical protein